MLISYGILLLLFIVLQKNKDCWGYVFNLKIFDAVRTSNGELGASFVELLTSSH